MLVRLMYASRAAGAVDQNVLLTILGEAKAHNPEHGITGVLCYSEGVFLQVLEGGRAEVNQLYNRIVADPRHTGVELMHYAEIDERRFAGWSMGQVNMARVNRALLLKYSAKAVLDPFGSSGAVSMAILDELVETASVICQP